MFSFGVCLFQYDNDFPLSPPYLQHLDNELYEKTGQLLPRHFFPPPNNLGFRLQIYTDRTMGKKVKFFSFPNKTTNIYENMYSLYVEH